MTRSPSFCVAVDLVVGGGGLPVDLAPRGNDNREVRTLSNLEVIVYVFQSLLSPSILAWW